MIVIPKAAMWTKHVATFYVLGRFPFSGGDSVVGRKVWEGLEGYKFVNDVPGWKII